MCVEGRFEGSDDPAVVIMNKTPFSEETAKAMLSGKNLRTKFFNRIQVAYQCFLSLKFIFRSVRVPGVVQKDKEPEGSKMGFSCHFR